MADLSRIFRPGPISAGTEDLFAALAGGGAAQEAAKLRQEASYLQTDSATAELDRKITQALLERDKRTAQQSYVSNFEANGVTSPVAALLSNAMIGGDANLEQAQKYDMRGRAETALAGEGFTPANAILAALQGKPVEAIDTQGGQNIRGQYTAAPVIEDTAETLSKIVANQARAGASNASANLSNIKADAGGYAPSRRATAIEDAAHILETMRGDPDLDLTGVDARMVADAIKRSGKYTPPLRKPGSIRVIQAERIDDIPVRGAQPQGNEPNPLEATEATPVVVKTKAERDALPVGTRYLAPNGVVMVKQ